jgi:hypothetical protein
MGFDPILLLGSQCKLVASRFAEVMDKLISVNRSAFIQGKLLVDGMMVVNQVVDLARRSEMYCLVFKIDFEKAYDYVN